MSTPQNPSTGSVLSAVVASLQATADYHKDDVVPPAAILWPDEKRDWERLAPRVRAALPQFLTLGNYNPANRTGPAIWLRCVLAGKIPEVTLPPGAVPILYLPGVGRPTLRATDECPPELKPLAELQYRGVFWSQQSGKDWTITAFLMTNHGGLQLRIARDAATAASIRRSLDRLLDVPVEELRTKAAAGELSSLYFDSLVVDDLVDDLLSWLADPKGTRDRWDADRFETLCSRCRSDYGFDPARDGELVGAEKLGTQDKAIWKAAWKRFAGTPGLYGGLVELLRKAKPATKGGDLFSSLLMESWPQDNEGAETALRNALLQLPSQPTAEARNSLLKLEIDHKSRRDWVWARLGRSPLATAAKYLAALAAATQTPLTGATTADMVQAYTESGWQADAAVLDSLASVTLPPDLTAVSGAIAHVYTPWLRDAAELFQERVKDHPLPGKNQPRLGKVAGGTCVLFVDGLRFDVGRKLQAALAGRVGVMDAQYHFVALPSVTPTAKPAVSPVAARITGSEVGEEFRPVVLDGGKDLTTDRFRKLLEEDKFQILGSQETGDSTGRAWTEFGNLDSTGHKEGIGLARRIPELIATLTHRIESLLAAGWREVRIVTDHGWLLVPGCLPKSDLPKYLAETRWGRCAIVKESATVTMPTFGWFWSEGVTVASPEGISSFLAGQEYNHGGLSLQECVVPQFSIRAGVAKAAAAKLEEAKWSRLRCRIKVAGDCEGFMVGLRDKAADPSTSLAEEKKVGKDGTASLVVENDQREGTTTNLVLLDEAGNVVDKMPVEVGS